MKILTVSEKNFIALKLEFKQKGEQALWEKLLEMEYNVKPFGRIPILAGGLDHVNVMNKQIEFHDIGCSISGKIHDNSFTIRIGKNL